MEHLELVHYIEMEQDKGVSKENIIRALLETGYSKEVVSGCFAYIEQKKTEHHVDTITQTTQVPPHRHRSLWLVIAGIIVIIIASYFIMTLAPEEEPIVHTPGRNLTDTERSRMYDELYNKCIEKWKKVTEPSCIALANDDIGKCTDIDCRDKFNIYKAIALEDSSLCGLISDSKILDNCAQESISKCETEVCKAVRAKDASKCIGSLNARSTCLAYISQDEFHCFNKLDCEDGAYLTIALLTKDFNDCEFIHNLQRADDCKTKITTVS